MNSTTTVPPKQRLIGKRILGSGLLDLLAGPPGVDGYLEQIRPAWAVRDRRAEVIAADRRTPDSVTLSLRANRAWEGFEAGQFVQVAVEIDGSRRTRCYSPASAAGSGRSLELTVKAHPEGLVSNFLIENARPGMVLGLGPAEGDFRLPPERPERILLISGGSGITPVISMLRTLCAEGHEGPIAFLHYAPDPELAIYRDELERIAAAHPNVRLVRSYTRAPGAGEVDGHFLPGHLAEIDPEYAEAETFACGPPALLDAVRERLGGRGSRAPPPRRELRAADSRSGERRSRGLHPLRRLRRPRLEQRRRPARAGRGGRAQSRIGLPDGHLPHLQLPQDGGHGSQPLHRRGLLERRRGDPDLRLSTGRRRRRRALTTTSTEENSNVKHSNRNHGNPRAERRDEWRRRPERRDSAQLRAARRLRSRARRDPPARDRRPRRGATSTTCSG